MIKKYEINLGGGGVINSNIICKFSSTHSIKVIHIYILKGACPFTYVDK